MNFHWPYVLFALPVALAVLLTLFARSHRARQRLLAQFAAARLLPALLASYSPGLRRLKHLLVITGVLLVVVALARPQWGYEWQEQRARGVDVIFVVDTSKSMLTQDVPPSRLERAKLAIMDLVEKMPGNRVGLVAFAGQAFLQCPLTLDYDAFRQSLEAIDTNTIARGGTNIAAGLDEAASALESSGNHKIIVLLSDGEDLEGDGVSTAKTLRDQGVIIYTVGVGTPEGDIIPLPTKDGQVNFVRDDHNQIVKSHLDAATLTAIANSTGGFYQPLGSTGEGLNQVYEAGIKTIPEQQIASREQRLPLERFQWPLAAGLLLLALELLIGTRRPFRTEERPRSSPPIPAAKSKSAARDATPVVAALVLAAAGFLVAPHAKADDSTAPLSPPNSPAQSLATPPPAAQSATLPSPAAAASGAALPPPSSPGVSPQVAEQLFQHGDYKAAAAAYGQAADQAPEDARFRYDQGASLYHSGDYDGAAHAFEQTLPANDLSLQQRAYYGLGDSRYRLGQSQLKEDPKKTVTTWESAVKDYQNALELNPNDADAHYNLDLLKTQLEQLKKQLDQQQKQQQQQQQQDQQNQQDQKNQQSQQNQQNQQDQKNQQGQQGQQNQQNQQGQQGQQDQKNQSGQQGQQSQQSNNPGSNGASQQNQNSQNQNSGQNQPKPGQDQKQNQGQSPQPSQNQKPGQNGDQKQPQPQPGTGDKPQPSNQSQNSNPGQQPNANGQPQPKPADRQGAQPNPASQPKGTEPGAAKPGQSSGNSTATAGAAGTSADKNGENGVDAVTGPGVMTREEARQVLDSLKNSERKLPVNSYDSQKEGAQSSDQTFKDW